MATKTIDELKSELRDFKISILNDEIKFKLITKFPNEITERLDFITSTFPDDVISGSLALNLLSLIKRRTNDIDILIPDPNRYSKYVLDGYDDEFSTSNRLGFKTFKYKKGLFYREEEYQVDFFENKNPTYLLFEYKGVKLKIHNPVEILQFKLDIIQNTRVSSITSKKHIEDLRHIFS
jgi:hypothetical protein